MWCRSSTSARTPRTATAAESFRGDAKRRTRNLSPMCNCTSEVWSFGPSRNDETLNLDLRPELNDLPCRHAEERGRAFGVALQEREQRLPPNPHAGDVFPGNDGLAADVIGDIGEIDAWQLALLAGEF